MRKKQGVPNIHRVINTAKFLPPITRDSMDVQEAHRVASLELQSLLEAINEVYSNQWIVSMTDYGLSQWESVFKVLPLKTESLENRRNRIFRLIKGERPYTIRSYARMLRNVWGDEKIAPIVEYDDYRLWLMIDSNLNYALDDIYAFTEEIVPKNLTIEFKNKNFGNCIMYIGAVLKERKINVVPCASVELEGLYANYSMGVVARIKPSILKVSCK